jgi:muramoyltetrapeptide carboxypeptidase
MVTKDFALDEGVDLVSWQAATGGLAGWEIGCPPDSGAVGLVDGAAEGILYGGCLSLLVASLGTPHEIRTAGSILFIEDVNARPYQIDRMLMQMKLAGKLSGVKGIVFGEMLDCVQTRDQGYTLQQVILRIVGELGVPVAYGLRSGHVTRKNITLPIGVRAALSVNGREVQLKILEAATMPA